MWSNPRGNTGESAATSSTTKEGPWRPFSWTEEWPVRGSYAAGVVGRDFQEGAREVGGQCVLDHRDGGIALFHRTHYVCEISCCRVSKGGGERLIPESADRRKTVASSVQALNLGR